MMLLIHYNYELRYFVLLIVEGSSAAFKIVFDKMGSNMIIKGNK